MRTQNQKLQSHKRQKEKSATNDKSLGITQAWGAVRAEPQDDHPEIQKAIRNRSISKKKNKARLRAQIVFDAKRAKQLNVAFVSVFKT